MQNFGRDLRITAIVHVQCPNVHAQVLIIAFEGAKTLFVQFPLMFSSKWGWQYCLFILLLWLPEVNKVLKVFVDWYSQHFNLTPLTVEGKLLINDFVWEFWYRHQSLFFSLLFQVSYFDSKEFIVPFNSHCW